MCGIFAVLSNRRITSLLLNGLKRLEYRGYDSAGVALIDAASQIQICKALGKVEQLAERLDCEPWSGHVGIAHTRWATHGPPTENNAHPIQSGSLAVVHNGIIENHLALKSELMSQGFVFTSDTDTEVLAHLLSHRIDNHDDDVLTAIQMVSRQLEGTYAAVVMHRRHPDDLFVISRGSPLVIGLGIDEHFISSDRLAFGHLVERWMSLQDGDVAQVGRQAIICWNGSGDLITPMIQQQTATPDVVEKGSYRHFMQKEIFEQPDAMMAALRHRLGQHTQVEALGASQHELPWGQVKHVHIIACGTSYHAGLLARYWFETILGIGCHVEVASEYRYRQPVVLEQTLLIAISQSGETADTLAALRQAKSWGYLGRLVICNVPESAMTREADGVLLTHAGTEIGVASTKAFTTQLVTLLFLVLALHRIQRGDTPWERQAVHDLKQLATWSRQALAMDEAIQPWAQDFVGKTDALFLGRGMGYPLALEGALKLKELSYIHAEAYPAGELKHGPLALVDQSLPVVTLVTRGPLLEKTRSNLQEVHARGGQLYCLVDEPIDLGLPDVRVLHLPAVPALVAPMIHIIPLQLLAYHVAVLKGTDVDQPRNLAKSVTVE